MKILSVIIIFSAFTFSQEIGIDFNIGYTKLKMEQVNSYLDNSEFVDYGSSLWNPPKYISIGQPVTFELGISMQLSPFVYRLSGSYLSSTGYWESLDTIRRINHDINVSTFEFLASVGYKIPIYKTASVLLEGGIGYGFALSEINYVTKSFRFYDELENIKYSLSGSYLSGRLRGGFEAKLQWLLLRFVIGYRFANPVILKGESIINGDKNENQPVIDSYNKELEFDFSGICYAWGITIFI